MPYYRNQSKPLPQIDEDAWLAAISERYGVRLGEGQLYADRRGYVMAGSEYVARLGLNGLSVDPEDAIEWTSEITSFCGPIQVHHTRKGQ